MADERIEHDGKRVYLELRLQGLRLWGGGFSWCVTLDAAR